MMGWLIALGIVFLLAVLPIGVRIRYDSEGILVRVIAGPVKITVFPLPGKKKKDKKKKPKKKTKEAAAEEENLPKPPQPPKKGMEGQGGLSCQLEKRGEITSRCPSSSSSWAAPCRCTCSRDSGSWSSYPCCP